MVGTARGTIAVFLMKYVKELKPYIHYQYTFHKDQVNKIELIESGTSPTTFLNPSSSDPKPHFLTRIASISGDGTLVIFCLQSRMVVYKRDFGWGGLRDLAWMGNGAKGHSLIVLTKYNKMLKFEGKIGLDAQ